MKNHIIFTLILLTSAMFIITSCEKDEDPDPPQLPPRDALVMDFSDFNNPGYASGTLKSFSENLEFIVGYENYGHAFVTVAVWNTLAGFAMAVPTITYAAALQENPVYLGDGKWQWEFSVDSGTLETYSAKLVASRISNEEFKAEMYITKTGLNGFADFKWYEGIIRYDRTHAEWTLYESAANPVELLSIEWNKDWEANTSDITYTNIKADGLENGSFIKYEKMAESQFDSRYTVSISTHEVIIEWDSESKAGHVMDHQKFGDELWHCWNELLQDVECE
jgi:hypothetical protein